MCPGCPEIELDYACEMFTAFWQAVMAKWYNPLRGRETLVHPHQPPWGRRARLIQKSERTEGLRKREAGGATHLQDLAAVRGAVYVLAGLVHAQRHAVEQDHHHADALEPREEDDGQGKQRGSIIDGAALTA